MNRISWIVVVGLGSLATLSSGCRPRSAEARGATPAQTKYVYVDITRSGQNKVNGFGDAKSRVDALGTELCNAAMAASDGSIFRLFFTGDKSGRPRQAATLYLKPELGREDQAREIRGFATKVLQELNTLSTRNPGTSPVLEDLAWMTDRVDGTKRPADAARAEIQIVSDGLQFSPLLKASKILACKDDKAIEALAKETASKLSWKGAPKIMVTMELTTSKDDAHPTTGQTLRKFYLALFQAAGFAEANVNYPNGE
jgi:hypothetical protein